MAVPPTYRISSANGWLGVFGSASKRSIDAVPLKEFARQFRGVAQAVSAGQPERNAVENIRTDEARRSRETQISDAIGSVPINMAPSLKPLFSAFLIIGVGHDNALQYSLDAIDRAAAAVRRGSIDEARDLLKNALSQLAPGVRAGGATPLTNPLTAPGRPERPPGA